MNTSMLMTKHSLVVRLLLLALVLIGLITSTVMPASAACGTTNIAPSKPISASSTQSGLAASAANDANTGTRWGSEWSDPQWIQIDLGSTQPICRVVLRWETAYGIAYQIQVSDNGTAWTTLYSTTTGDGSVDDIGGLNASARYIRMVGTVRATEWGYSLWEFEVYADAVTVTPTPTATRTPTATSTVSTPSTSQPGSCGNTNMALNKPATALSSESAAMTANYAVDGSAGTRWSSAFSDPQWIQIDLGSTYTICRVSLSWEAAFGRSYQIQVSNDATNWATAYTTTTGDGGIDDLTGLNANGRYIRMNGTVRATAYGYSLWEFGVYTTTATATQTPTATATLTPTATLTSTPSGCGTSNIALSRPATASSSENGAMTANYAVDGNAGTRWSSLFSDPQWIQVDLGFTQSICRVRLSWEAAYARSYQIQVSDNASSWTTIYTTTTGDGGIDDLTGLSASGRYIRMNGTVRATEWGYSLWEFEVYAAGVNVTPTAAPSATPTADSSFWGDTSNIPAAQNVMTFKFLNKTNGRYPDSQVFWSFNGQTYSIAERPTFDMPANSAGRMYFYLGSPTSQYSDFIEFTIGPNIFNGNTTRVDAFGLKLAMRLHTDDGYDAAVGEDYTTFAEDRAVTFQRFYDEVPAEFKHLAQIQAPYRIPAPGRMGETAFLPGGQYENYFAAYAASVGLPASTTAFDIFACAGYLADKPGLCAAMNRHVAHLSESSWFDTALYYQSAPANYYSKFWHDHSLGGLAYGFPYDDYADQSSFITHSDPQWLLIAIGW